MTGGQPNARYPHVYVVIRVDRFEGLDTSDDLDEITVTRVFAAQSEAEAEVDRLNELASQRGITSRYIFRIGRLRGSASEPT